MKSNKKINIGLITSPIGEANKTPVSNLVKILRSLAKDIYFITGNAGCGLFKENREIHTYCIQYKLGTNALTKIVRHFYMQLRISYMLTKVAGNVDIWIFFVGANTLVLPVLTLKILRKQVVLASPAGSFKRTLKFANDRFYIPVQILEKMNFILANSIILYSEKLTKESGLEKYGNKVCIGHEHFLDFDVFKLKKKLGERGNLVGFIGRLSGEKGILNFVKAISGIMNERDDIKFLICGDGPLRNKITEYLDKENLINNVILTGWVAHDKLPEYLNELKLVVLPSYTEGLPNILLEAMACGTPVLTTPVGMISQVIKDENNGFVMVNNSPECITENILRALKYANLTEITKNARVLVERDFSYETAVKGYKYILEKM